MPRNENVFFSVAGAATGAVTAAAGAAAAWRRRAASRLVHRARRWAQDAGAVTAERPGLLHFARIGPGTRLAHPLGTVFGERWIHLGDHCIIGEQVTLTVGLMPTDARPDAEDPGAGFGPDPVLRLGHGVVLGRGSHVVALAPITLGEKVYCGPYVYLTSINHSYDDVSRPIGEQWPRTAPVEIGAGSWLGAGCVILPGARLGRNVVVAAGSVVRGDVPDFAVVAGAPARVVRRWDAAAETWQPPLRTPAPVPFPAEASPEQLLDTGDLEQQA
ncbi:acyltransferase [Actinacidiphila bryophytorum]|uniref:Transferase hexapeptide (Six repeat-containing protein) n=1 Tax=Actinacidiphila bryophytorum TaxID=1436133 RepID=A0A9W4H8K1_9ACTN|nr:Transferase hexapeptide (Six repeat-containing protein) [Actinacidiphila bryophytorum]